MVTNKYKVIAHIFVAQWGGGHLTVHKVDCLGEETVPGCPGIRCSVASDR